MSIPVKYAPIPDWCAISGMSRSTTYEALGRGDLRAIKLGARTLIDVEHGLAWLASMPAAEISTGRNRRSAPSLGLTQHSTAAEIAAALGNTRREGCNSPIPIVQRRR